MKLRTASIILCCLLGLSAFIPRLHAEAPTVKTPHKGWEEALGTPELFKKTRDRALRLTRADLDVPTTPNPTKPFGVLVEIAEYKVTILALADGTASLYFTNGKGRMGTNEALRKAARDVLAQAAKMQPQIPAPKEFPFPTQPWVYFYFLTDRGVFMERAVKHVLPLEKTTPLSILYFAALEIDKQHGLFDQKK